MKARFHPSPDSLIDTRVGLPKALAIADDLDTLNYAELSAKTDRIASALIAEGVETGSLVAIELPRSLDVIVAILGVWKACAAYVPLTIAMPGQRRQQIIDDAKPAMVIDLDKWKLLESFERIRSDLPKSDPSDLAYVMYTSGSTGTPKGVAIEHHSISNLLSSFADQPGFTAADTMLAVTTTTFDISVLEMFLPIWCGGRVRMTAHQISDAPETVVDIIEQSKPTHVQSTPSAFRMLLSTGWRPDGDLTLLCGGEPFMPDLAGELLSTNDRLWNVYGPTETTVWSTLQQCDIIGRYLDRATDCQHDLPRAGSKRLGISGWCSG